VHSRGKKIEPDLDFDKVARATAGFTGADLMNLMNQSAITAVRAVRRPGHTTVDACSFAILPQHSVMPYDTKKRQPKTAVAAATLAGGSGEPPQDRSRRLDRSALRSAGLLSSSVTMVDARLVTDTRSRSVSATCKLAPQRHWQAFSF